MAPNVRPPFRMTPQMRQALNSQLPREFQDVPTGAWQTFDFVSPVIAPAGPLAGTVQFPVFSALFEIQAAVFDAATPPTEGTADLGYLDLATFQFTLPGGTQLNAGAPVIGTALFNRQTGIKMFRKPWVIAANQPIAISGASLAGTDNIQVYLTFTVLLLELATDAAQF